MSAEERGNGGHYYPLVFVHLLGSYSLLDILNILMYTNSDSTDLPCTPVTISISSFNPLGHLYNISDNCVQLPFLERYHHLPEDDDAGLLASAETGESFKTR